jgi:phospholipid-binding lipoprotein MlaA
MSFMMRGVLVPIRTLSLLLLALAATGCASAPGRTSNEDPWEGMNRGIYKFNDTVDRATLKPVAKAYNKVTPHWLRIGIGNFFHNLAYPTTAANQFLQGKGKLGLRDTGRFLINTTLGLAGIFDVATAMGLEANDEDIGQTLAVWGVGSGPYLTVPFFGPSSLRDAPSRVLEFFFDPMSYMEIPWEAEWGRRGLNAVNSRAELLSLDPTLQSTFDPYAFVRDAWVQQREYNIFDGEPPPETFDEGEFEEEPAEKAEPQPGD